MLDGPLQNIRSDLMILEAFCNLNDSMVTQYQSQQSYQKKKIKARNTLLAFLINKRHQTQQQVLFCMYSGEKEKKIFKWFSNTWENIEFYFFRGTKDHSYPRPYDTGSFAQTYNV